MAKAKKIVRPKKKPSEWVVRQVQQDMNLYIDYMKTEWILHTNAARDHLVSAFTEYLVDFVEQGYIHDYKFTCEVVPNDGLELDATFYHEDSESTLHLMADENLTLIVYTMDLPSKPGDAGVVLEDKQIAFDFEDDFDLGPETVEELQKAVEALWAELYFEVHGDPEDEAAAAMAANIAEEIDREVVDKIMTELAHEDYERAMSVVR